MHPYENDSEERKWVVVGLVGISILIVWLFYGRLEAMQKDFPWLVFPWWIEAPSIVSVFGFLYYAFDQWFWHWPIFRWLGLVKTPNIRGEWQGCVKTSHDGHSHEHPVTVTVSQTWTRLLVCLKAEHSASKSVTAAMSVSEDRVPVLRFIYLNDPQPEAKKPLVLV